MPNAPDMYGKERELGMFMSSAGLETQPLPAPTFGVRIPQLIHRIILTFPLIVIGALFLTERFWPGKIHWQLGALLLTLAAGFFVAAVWQRNFAFCIPACILGGLSVGLPVVALLGPVPLVWGLAAGFAMLFWLGRALFNAHELWPLFPAAALFVTGVFLLIFG